MAVDRVAVPVDRVSCTKLETCLFNQPQLNSLLQAVHCTTVVIKSTELAVYYVSDTCVKYTCM